MNSQYCFLSRKRKRSSCQGTIIKKEEKKMEREKLVKGQKKITFEPLSYKYQSRLSTKRQIKREELRNRDILSYFTKFQKTQGNYSSSISFFSPTKHFELNLCILSYLSSIEIRYLYQSIQSKSFHSLLNRITFRLTKVDLSFHKTKRIILHRFLTINHSQSLYNNFFNNIKHFSPCPNINYYQSRGIDQYYLEQTKLIHCQHNTKIKRFFFNNDLVMHFQFIKGKDNLIAVFCFFQVIILNIKTRAMYILIPHSGNYLLYKKTLKLFVMSSDTSGYIYYLSKPGKGAIAQRIKYFSQCVDIIDLNNHTIAAYSIDEHDKNNIVIIDLKTLKSKIMNEGSKEKLIMVTDAKEYNHDLIISADRDALCVWNWITLNCIQRIRMNVHRVIRVNYLPMIRSDCFAVFGVMNKKEEENKEECYEGKLMFIDGRYGEKEFKLQGFQMKIDMNKNDFIYSIAKGFSNGIKLNIFSSNTTPEKSFCFIKTSYLISNNIRNKTLS